MVYVDIPPFTIVMYPRLYVKEKYEPIFSKFNNITSLIELDLVRDGFRECDVYHVTPENMYEQLKIIYDYGLKFKPINYVRRYEGFAHKHEQPTGIHDVMIYGGVCRSDSGLYEFENAHRRGDHDKIGELLGYPKCDRKFFVKYWSKGRYDMIPEVAMNTENTKIYNVSGWTVIETTFDPLLNIALRYAGLRFLTYFPHSFKCEDSRKFALEVLRRALDYNPNIVKTVAKILSYPFKWSQASGIIEVENGLMKIIAGGFDTKPVIVKGKPEYWLLSNVLDKL